MNRQRLILFVLVLLFICAALWSYSTMPRLKTAGPQTPKAAQRLRPAPVAAKAIRTADDGTRLNISLLDKESTSFKGYRRNIFKPVFVDELKVVKQKAVAMKRPPVLSSAPVKQPVIIQPATAPLASFTFLGFLKKGSVKTIFLAKDNDILLVKKGDKVAGRYEATEITDQSLTLAVTDTGDEIVIPLQENRPLVSAK